MDEYNCINCGKFCRKPNTLKKYCSNKCQQDHYLQVKITNGTASQKTLKRYFVHKLQNTCSSCGIKDWNGKPLVLELEHIDGDSTNNKLDNLTLLCPNCHSQTDTYKSKNIGNGRHYRRVRYAEGKSF
jgi:hypothetical protein